MWQFEAHGMYCALRTHLLGHDSPTSDDLLHSLLSPLGFFSHPPAPKNTREPDLLGKMVEYMRFLHVTMRNTQADPRWCTKLKMAKVNGISQLTAQVFALKKELEAPSGGPRSSPHLRARSQPHTHGRPTHTRSADERGEFIYGLQLHPMPVVVELFAHGAAGKREALRVARRVRADVDDERYGDSKLRLELPKETLVLSMDPMSGFPARQISGRSDGRAGSSAHGTDTGKGKGTGSGVGAASHKRKRVEPQVNRQEGDLQSSTSEVYATALALHAPAPASR
tara:strand:- start:47 stop:892 length:846 start_codon:yes stop_codon:yes gene_type:complete